MFNLSLSLSRSLPGVEQAAKGHEVFYVGTGELLYGITREWDAKMPACRKEDGGGVIAKCLAVMARTR